MRFINSPHHFARALRRWPELEGTRLAERAERVEFLVLQRELSQEASDDFAVIGDAFDEYFSNDFWIVWQARSVNAVAADAVAALAVIEFVASFESIDQFVNVVVLARDQQHAVFRG